MKLQSTAFAHGAPIPTKYTGEGLNVSPPLTWTGIPLGTKSFVLICDDPDAPSRSRPAPQPWVHWVMYNIPPSVESLPERVARDVRPKVPLAASQGINSWPSDNVGYLGPMPPPGSGPHRYFFKLYALDTGLSLNAQDATKSVVLDAMKGHILAVAELIGTYERK